MLKHMFSGQAKEQGVELRVVCPAARIVVAPLPTMRIMTNLVANALAHAHATRVLVGFRPKGDVIVFQVHDNGVGIDEESLQKSLEPGKKGPDSLGQGLGLGIVTELCRSARAEFRLVSREGRGTSAFVSLPRN